MDFIVYEIKTAVLFAGFYLFYRLLLSKETFHRLNRVVLLCSAAVAALLPLCRITVHKTVEVPVRLENLPYAFGMQPGIQENVAGQTGSAFPSDYILLGVLVAGALAVIANTAASVFSVIRIVRRGKRIRQPDGTVIVVTQREVAPFSWMKYIVLSEKDYSEKHDEILIHEKAHIRLGHSWDILFINLFTALQWFNPVIWMLRSDLRAIHEYEADREVLKSGINATQYQFLLIKKAVGLSGHSITNSFNHSTLKKRITMMSCKKSTFVKALRVLYAIPLIGICLAANAKTDITYVSSAAPDGNGPYENTDADSTTISGTEGTMSYIVTYHGKDTQSPDKDKQKLVLKSGELTVTIGENGEIQFKAGNSVETGTVNSISLKELLKKKGITVDKLGEKGTVLTITDEGVDKNDVFFDVIKNIKFKQNGKDFPDDIPIDSLNGKSFGLNYESISSLDKIYIMSDPEGEGIIIDFVKEQ